MKRSYFTPAVQKALWILGILTAFGSAYATLDDRWAKRTWAEQQLAQVDRRQDFVELNDVDSKILYWEQEKRRRPLRSEEENLLNRLYRQRDILCQALKIDCRRR